MTIRKLVELDGPYGYPKEVDFVKLKRVTTAFKAWLLTVDPHNDPFNFLKWDLPLVEAALNGTMVLPYKGNSPHNWEIREGLLPREYMKISSPFYNTIRGAALCMPPDRDIPPEVLQKEGRYYAWCEFEEPPSEDST